MTARVARWGGVAALVAVAGVLAVRLLRPEPLPPGFLYANGQLEATEVRVAAEIQGRVLAGEIVEGIRVGQGDVLLVLDGAEIERQLAEGRASEAALAEAEAATEPELRTWRHHLHTATTELARARQLESRGAASSQRVDQAENALEEARGRVGALEANARRLEAEREAAAQRLAQLEIARGKTTVRAPIAGTILVRAIEVGEFATPGRTVAVIADLDRMELRAFVPQHQVAKVRLGSDARIRIDAFPDRSFEAHVSQIDDRAQFTPREVHVPDERVRLMFGITLTADNARGYLKPGMPADAWIRWDSEAKWPERLPIPE